MIVELVVVIAVIVVVILLFIRKRKRIGDETAKEMANSGKIAP